MFVYNFKEDKLPEISNLKANINTEILTVQSQINSIREKEETIYKSFVNITINRRVNFDNVFILNDFNKAFSVINDVIANLDNQKEQLDNINNFVEKVDYKEEKFDKNEFLNKMQNLLEDYYECKNKVQLQIVSESQNLNNLVKTLDKYNYIEKPKSNFIPYEKKKNSKEKQKEKVVEKQEDNVNEKVATSPVYELKDNRSLVISERENKVYLPYFATDLKQSLLKSDYANYEELIESDYVLPLKNFKSPVISRFREGFKLMREKEYESLKTSLAFGLKVMNNYKLHPAVITACRTVDELNCFLDCLEEDSLNNFDIFDIRFDVTPTKKNKMAKEEI